MGAVENVVKGGHLAAVRVAALDRLIELLRVTHEDKRLCCLRDGEHVGEGHLRGLVDEEHIDRFKCVRTRPEPGRPTADVHVVADGRDEVFTPTGKRQPMLLFVFFIGLMTALKIDAEPIRFLDDLVDEIPDDLVAVRGDPDCLALSDEGADHSRCRKGLPSARRSLHGQNAFAEMLRQS